MGTWLGRSFLLYKYKEYTHNFTEADRAHYAAQRAARNAKAEKRREEAKINALKSKQRDQETLLTLLQYHRDFNQAPQETGSDAYLSYKGISEIAHMTNIKQVPAAKLVLDANGNPVKRTSNKPLNHFDNRPYPAHLSIPFYRLDRPAKAHHTYYLPVAYQRIFLGSDGSFHKYNTNTIASDDMSMTGSAHVIGKLVDGAPIVVGEGFATVASAVLANKKLTGVVAYSSGNITVVVDILRDSYPHSDIIVIADNDRQKCKEGKGNAGLLAAIKILRKHGRAVRVQVPRFGQHEKGNDFNDLHTMFGLEEVAKQLKNGANRLILGDRNFNVEMLTLRYVPNEKLKEQIGRVINSGIALVPSILSRQEVFEQIRDTIKYLGAQRKIPETALLQFAHQRLMYRYKQKTDKAQSQRSFSARITDPAQRPAHINYIKLDVNGITEEVLNLIRDLDGPCIVRAGMAMGKTSGLIKPLMREYNTAICAAHRVSLMEDMHGKIAGYKYLENGQRNPDFQSDIFYYKDEAAPEMISSMPKLVVCINSLIRGHFKPLVKDHDFFALDEATQNLSSIITGTAMSYPVKVFETLVYALATTNEKILLTDADANDHLVWLLEVANKKRSELGLPSWDKINVIELPVNIYVRDTIDGVAVNKKITVQHTTPDRTVFEMQQSIMRGEKFLLATDSPKTAEQIIHEIKQENQRRLEANASQPDHALHKRPLTWLYVSQDTKPEEAVKEFQSNTDKYCVMYDVLIYSPAISSGVSMTTKHFEKHYAIFYGQVLPSNAIQMLRRDRTASHFLIGFGAINSRREESLKNLAKGLIEAQIDNMDCKITDEGFVFASHDTLFNRLRMTMTVEENAARNDFTNNMLLILESDGYIVERLDHHPEKDAIAKANRIEANKVIIEQRNELHKAVPSISESERQELLKAETLNEQQRAQLNRYMIENELHLTCNDPAIEFYHTGGMAKAKRFEVLMMDKETAKAYDAAERKTLFELKLKPIGSPFANTLRIVADNWADAEKRRKMAHANTVLASAEIEGEVTSNPVTQICQRAYLEWQTFYLQRYFDDLGLCRKTGAGIIDQQTLKHAADKLVLDAKGNPNYHLYNTVSAIGGRMEPTKQRRPIDILKTVCDKLGLELKRGRAPRRTSNGETLWSITSESWQRMINIHNKRSNLGQCFYNASELLDDDLTVVDWKAFMTDRYLDDAGFDIQTGKGEATDTTLQKAAQRLTTDSKGKPALTIYNTLCAIAGRIEPEQERTPLDIFNVVCKNLGLEYQTTNQNQTRTYGLTEASQHTITARAAERGGLQFSDVGDKENDLAMIHDLPVSSIDLNDDRGSLTDSATVLDKIAILAAERLGICPDWVRDTFTPDELVAHFNDGFELDLLLRTILEIYRQDGHIPLSVKQKLLIQ
ncbi:toprim domain-containing protein [Vibrio cholerae]|nr:toprim domain-containing protein [Vibrio cholerae]